MTKPSNSSSICKNNKRFLSRSSQSVATFPSVKMCPITSTISCVRLIVFQRFKNSTFKYWNILLQTLLISVQLCILMPSVTKDLVKRHNTKGVQYPSRLAGQSPGLTGIKQNREDQRAKLGPSSFCTSIGSATHVRPANSSRSRLPVVD